MEEEQEAPAPAPAVRELSDAEISYLEQIEWMGRQLPWTPELFQTLLHPRVEELLRSIQPVPIEEWERLLIEVQRGPPAEEVLTEEVVTEIPAERKRFTVRRTERVIEAPDDPGSVIQRLPVEESDEESDEEADEEADEEEQATITARVLGPPAQKPSPPRLIRAASPPRIIRAASPPRLTPLPPSRPTTPAIRAASPPRLIPLAKSRYHTPRERHAEKRHVERQKQGKKRARQTEKGPSKKKSTSPKKKKTKRK